jgi:hypothetical protein
VDTASETESDPVTLGIFFSVIFFYAMEEGACRGRSSGMTAIDINANRND